MCSQINPRISECATSFTALAAEQQDTMLATSAAMAHQYRKEAGRDTVALHSRLRTRECEEQKHPPDRSTDAQSRPRIAGAGPIA